jgi:lipoic acid synthetase
MEMRQAALSRLRRLHRRFSSVTDRLAAGPTLNDFINDRISSPVAGERLPSWLKTPIPTGKQFTELKRSLRSLGLATVCEEAKCPNIGECWSGQSKDTVEDGPNYPSTATIMIMGDECTRGCRFCSVKTSRTPKPLDPDEPNKVAEAVAKWDVGYIVLTSVDRDDLADGGSAHFAQTVKLLKEKQPGLLVECLTGDFGGNVEHAARVTKSGLDVHAHNVETVERLTPQVRDHRAGYKQSLRVLEHAKTIDSKILTKSSIMLGCGETEEEIRQTLKDLRMAGVDCVTLGQYMRPTKRHMKVSRYVPPHEFNNWSEEALALGFLYAPAGPLVRSSYRAGEYYLSALLKNRRSS